MVMLMLGIGPNEILFCFWIILIIIVICAIYKFLISKNEHIKALESRIEILEKEKNMNELSDDFLKK
jgi:hypothetical protein